MNRIILIVKVINLTKKVKMKMKMKMKMKK
jgi:hypothetical protein